MQLFKLFVQLEFLEVKSLIARSIYKFYKCTIYQCVISTKFDSYQFLVLITIIMHQSFLLYVFIAWLWLVFIIYSYNGIFFVQKFYTDDEKWSRRCAATLDICDNSDDDSYNGYEGGDASSHEIKVGTSAQALQSRWISNFFYFKWPI